MARKNFAKPPNSALVIMAIICLLAPMAQLSADIYTPSLPAISHTFQVSSTQAKMLMSIYTFAVGFFQLIYGPLSDSIGRKIPLLSGIFIYIIGSLLATFAPNISVLFIARFIEGMGVCAASVLFKSLVSDHFHGDEIAIRMSTVAMAWSLAPVIGPAIGGYIQYWLGWRFNFALISCYGIIVLLFILFSYQESLPEHTKIKFHEIRHKMSEVISSPVYIASSLLISVALSVLLAFGTLGSFLLQKGLSYSPIQFGHVALGAGVVIYLSSVLNKRLLRMFSKITIMTLFLYLSLVNNTIMLILGIFHVFNAWIIIIPSYIYAFTVQFFGTNAISIYIDYFKRQSGIASSLLGFLGFILTALYITLVSLFHTMSVLPLACLYLSGSLVVYFSIIIIKKSVSS